MQMSAYRPVELPLPLSTTDPPTSPATYAHFNEGNFDGNDNDGNDDDAAQYNGSDASEVGGVFVGIDSNNARFPAIMPNSKTRTILVTVLVSRAITTGIPIPMAMTI